MTPRSTELRYTSGSGDRVVEETKPHVAAPFEAALGIIPGCELGASVDLVAGYTEARCQPYGYGTPNGVALAVSARVGTALDLGGKGGKSDPYVSSGLDTTVPLGGVGLLGGVYVRYGRRWDRPEHAGIPDEPDEGWFSFCAFGCPSPWIETEQTEVRLCFPLGVAVLPAPEAREHVITRPMVGVVPSFVLNTRDQQLSCLGGCASDVRVTSFKEFFSLTLVGRVELDWSGAAAEEP